MLAMGASDYSPRELARGLLRPARTQARDPRYISSALIARKPSPRGTRPPCNFQPQLGAWKLHLGLVRSPASSLSSCRASCCDAPGCSGFTWNLRTKECWTGEPLGECECDGDDETVCADTWVSGRVV